MDQFPSLTDVGDMLALGINIEPEQQALLKAPPRRPVVAVWGLPDPVMESGDPFYIKGMPTVVPVTLETCIPEEMIGQWQGGPHIQLGTALCGPDGQEPFETPVVVGETTDFGVYPYMVHSFEVTDDHFARDLWDLWPVDHPKTYIAALEAALDKSGYLALVDWFQWEMGWCDPYDEDHFKLVENLVTDGLGNLKDADEFEVKLELPKAEKYAWEKLIDLSQQGTTSYGMSLPAEERKRFFYPNGATPWF